MRHLYPHRLLYFVVALTLLLATPACALAQWPGAASGPPAPIGQLAQDDTRLDARSAVRVLAVPSRLQVPVSRAAALSFSRGELATGWALQTPRAASAASAAEGRPGQAAPRRRSVWRRAVKGGLIGGLAGAAFASWHIMGGCEAGPCFTRPDLRRYLLAWTVGGAAAGAFMGAVTAGDPPSSRD